MFFRLAFTLSTALLMSAQAFSQVGGGPTNSTVYSNTSAEVDTYHNTSNAQRVDTFSLELIGRLQGGAALYDQSFTAVLGDPGVQAAITTLQAVLATAGATTILAPSLLSSNTSLSGSVMQTTESNRNIISSFDIGTYVGPWTLPVGDLGVCASYSTGSPRGNGTGQAGGQPGTWQGLTVSNCVGGSPTLFTLAGGQIDIDLFTLNTVDIFTTTTMTDTFLTRMVYEFTGIVPSTPGTVPIPGTLGLLLTGALALLWRPLNAVKSRFVTAQTGQAVASILQTGGEQPGLSTAS